MFNPQVESEAQISEGLVPHPDAIRLVPKNAAYEARLLPLRVENRKLVCMGYDPIDLSQVSVFQAAVCREVSIVIGQKSQVHKGLFDAYGSDRDGALDEIIDSVATSRAKFQPSSEASAVPRLNTGEMKIFAVTSGKGGVGKSSMTTNIALTLARRGYKVGVIDCDFGLSNMHVMLGAKPKFDLADVVEGKVEFLHAFELVAGGIYLLAGAPGAAEFANLNYAALQGAGAGFSAIAQEFDFLFLDTAAGIHEGVLSLLTAADETLLVMTPEPASILDAFITGQSLIQRNPRAVISCIVNQAATETEAKLIFAKFKTFLGLNGGGQAEYLGKVALDKAAKSASKNRTPFVLSAPNCQAAKDIDAIVCQLARIPLPTSVSAGIFEKLFGKIRAA